MERERTGNGGVTEMKAANKQTKMSTINTLSNEAREKMDASLIYKERGLDYI